MSINDLTIADCKELAKFFGKQPETSAEIWQIGKKYLIRTVTMALTGRLIALGEKELVIADAAWVADTGRFHDALVKGTLNEVEPFPGQAIVGRGAIVDACEWLHDLPRTQK